MLKIPTLVAALCLSLMSASAYANALQLANGAWGVDSGTVPVSEAASDVSEFRNCAGKPVRISIDAPAKRYRAVHVGEENFVSEGDILASNTTTLSVRYDDETRLMANGEAQIWHMIFLSDDRFVWAMGPELSEDGLEGVVQAERVRCLPAIG